MSTSPEAIQPVEDVYRLIWTAVESRHPVAAVYNQRCRLLCPHRLGRNKQGQLRVLCYQYGGESESGLQPVGSPANWRCIALEKLSVVKLLEDAWRTAPNIPAPAPALPMPTLMLKIIRNGIHKRGTEEGA